MSESIENVATVLEQELTATIQRWMKRVDEIPELTSIHLDYEQRTGHLPQLIADLITRLRLNENEQRPETTSAHDHGNVRFEQGYSVTMLVEESRMLQVCIFDTLQQNLATIDFSVLLIGVMTIADEIDSQLSQAMDSFIARLIADAVPA